MLIFADTAEVFEIRELYDSGFIDGVTTNPSLVAKTGKNFHTLISDITSACSGPVSAEVISVDYENMIKEGEILAALANNVVVKLPITHDGLKACKRLSRAGIKTNMTLCFSPAQALMAARAGATYISPFVGRLDDIGANGVNIVKEICELIRHYSFPSLVLAASIRHYLHIQQMLEIGVHAITIPPKLVKECINHPLTDIGLKIFAKDWNSRPNVE